MKINRELQLSPALFFLISILLTNGCGSDDDNPVVPTPSTSPNITLDNAWPNDDGASWKYAITARKWDFPFIRDGISQPPPIPTFAEIEALLANHPIGDSPIISEGFYLQQFAGMETTSTGVIAQSLRESTYAAPTPVLNSRSVSREFAFFDLLVRARPDLKERVFLATGYVFSALQAEPFPADPLLIHGGAWQKTEDWIGSYGEIEARLAWKFLESNLEVGHEFSYQLTPSIADDIFLRVRVSKTSTPQTPAGSFPGSIEVVYIVDFGLTTIRGPSGEVLSYHRDICYGSVTYAPKIGPISSYERRDVIVTDTISVGSGDVALFLLEETASEPKNGQLGRSGLSH